MTRSKKYPTKNTKKYPTTIDLKKEVFTIPNMLTLLRIILAPIFMFVLLERRYTLAFIIILVAALTDLFDGVLARKLGAESRLGAILDPIADKTLIFFAVVAMLIAFNFPLWFGIILISRDLFILLAGLLFIIVGKHASLKPNMLGKTSTFIQMSILTIYVIASANNYYATWIGILLYFTAAMTIISGVSYAIKGYHILKEGESNGG